MGIRANWFLVFWGIHIPIWSNVFINVSINSSTTMVRCGLHAYVWRENPVIKMQFLVANVFSHLRAMALLEMKNPSLDPRIQAWAQKALKSSSAERNV